MDLAILIPRPLYNLAIPVNNGLGFFSSGPLTSLRNWANGVRGGEFDNARCCALVYIRSVLISLFAFTADYDRN
jgi:hypothetical protein